MDIKSQKLISAKKFRDHHFSNTVAGYYALLNQNIEVYQEILVNNDSLVKKISGKIE
jgi:hypothetical protein